jgi:hypothetical protein
MTGPIVEPAAGFLRRRLIPRKFLVSFVDRADSQR